MSHNTKSIFEVGLDGQIALRRERERCRCKQAPSRGPAGLGLGDCRETRGQDPAEVEQAPRSLDARSVLDPYVQLPWGLPAFITQKCLRYRDARDR